MRTYFQIFRTTLIEYFVYRLNFVLWRFRMVIWLMITYFLWSSIYESRLIVFGYTQMHMLTYVLLASLAGDLVLSTKTADIAGEIVSGKIIDYIIKPISFFSYQLTRDLADKLINASFGIVEVTLIILILKPPLFIQNEPLSYIFFFSFLVLGIIISFFVNLILSFVGFWSAEVWAPRFIFYIIISMFSGGFFPIDILPKPLFAALLMTPFPYFYYVPTKLYLSPQSDLLPLFAFMSLFWVVGSYLLARKVWNIGLRKFSFFGR